VIVATATPASNSQSGVHHSLVKFADKGRAWAGSRIHVRELHRSVLPAGATKRCSNAEMEARNAPRVRGLQNLDRHGPVIFKF
jgi:hypothetical protein